LSTHPGDTTLVGVPPEVFEYRLGNRSALEWVVDQYQVSTDKRSGIINDPNRSEDPEYIVRLIGQVITVSLETVKIVRSLPCCEEGGTSAVEALANSITETEVETEMGEPEEPNETELPITAKGKTVKVAKSSAKTPQNEPKVAPKVTRAPKADKAVEKTPKRTTKAR
jgi:hypothetical protein